MTHPPLTTPRQGESATSKGGGFARQQLFQRGTGAILATICLVLAALPGCERTQNYQPPPSTPAETPAAHADSIRQRYITQMNVGKAHYQRRSGMEAVEAFTKAVELLPTELAAHLNLARAYLLAIEFEKAFLTAEKVLELDRYSTAASYISGLAHMKLGHVRRAVAHLERAARDDPATAAVQFQWGSALLLDGQSDRAAEALRATLQLQPDHLSAHYKLANIARQMNDQVSFQRHINEHKRLRQNMPDAQRAPDYLEKCKYTLVIVPTEIHQPAAETITVRFLPRPISPEVATLRVLAVVDVDNDGKNDFIGADRDGFLRVARNAGTRFERILDALGGVQLSKDSSTCRAADFDNDGLVDLFVFGRSGAFLLKQSSGLRFDDVTQAAGLKSEGCRDAAWIDYDHEGDLDLLLVSPTGSLALWQNRGNATFINDSTHAGIPVDTAGVTGVRPADMDNDEQMDVVVAAAVGPAWQLHNIGLGEFEPEAIGDSDLRGPLLMVEDFDNDLAPDVVLADGSGVHTQLSGGGVPSLSLADATITQSYYLDYDNDGWLDLLLLCRHTHAAAQELSVRLYRNVGAGGWRDETETTGLASARAIAGSNVLIADFDSDGDTDIILNDASGDLVMYANEGGNQHAQLQLRLTGTRSNKSGIGTLIEINAGSFRLSRTVTSLPIEIGVGDRDLLDSVRTIWPNGIVDHAIWVNPAEPQRIEEPFVSAGSCPYLYAWDGRKFRFVTDILGASPLGLSLRRGAFVPADTDEYVWLGNGGTFPARDGRYAVQITDELREVLYLDHVRLVAVDHPGHDEVHPTNKLRPPPFVDAEIWSMHQPRGVLHAIDSDGNDWTRELQETDGKLTQPPTRQRPQLRGRAVEHHLELEFGNIDATQPLLLVMTGWLMWGDAGVNVSEAQNPDLPNPWPRLDTWADGTWRPISVTVGAPAGKTKSIIVDLSGCLPEGATRLRLTTALELYWDRITLFERHMAPEWVVTTLELATAKLHWRGFPRQIRPDPRQPVLPDPTDIAPTAPWRTTPAGWCTRYGEVRELLTALDDRFAILNGGDAVLLEFAGHLSDLPSGWKRDFFLYCDGWDKDSDYNVAFGATVEPLPFHGMDDQRYGRQRRSAMSNGWIERFNTRWVGP